MSDTVHTVTDSQQASRTVTHADIGGNFPLDQAVVAGKCRHRESFSRKNPRNGEISAIQNRANPISQLCPKNARSFQPTLLALRHGLSLPASM